MKWTNCSEKKLRGGNISLCTIRQDIENSCFLFILRNLCIYPIQWRLQYTGFHQNGNMNVGKTKLHAPWRGAGFLLWFTVSLDVAKPGYSMCGLQKNSVSNSWELARNADSQVPSQTYWIRIRILTRFPDDSCTH